MDKKYWNNVFKARKEIYDMMMELGVSSVRDTGSVNPFYNQITDNGGIGLEFYYGRPAKLYTPLGYIRITCNFTCGGNENDIVERLIADYGAVLIEEKKTSSMGLFGPIYSITKLPWTSEQLPVFEYRKKEDYINYDEAKKLYKEVVEE